MQIRKTHSAVFTFLATLLSAFASPLQQSGLRIEISNIRKNNGKVVVEIYKDKSSWLKKPFQRVTLSTDESVKTASFAVPPGKYAVSIYQDVNEDEELGMNLLGIPKEPVGFGNNYRPFGKPDFESALIEYSATSKPAAIKLFSVF